MSKIEEGDLANKRARHGAENRPQVLRVERHIQRRESVLLNTNDERGSVSLKEYLLAMRSADHEMVERERASVDLRFELAERALELDHLEMLRRLDLLNHA
jgi:hypothetical protein